MAFVRVGGSLSLPGVPRVGCAICLFSFSCALTSSSHNVMAYFEDMLRERNCANVASSVVGHAVKGALRRSFDVLAKVASTSRLRSFERRCSGRTSVCVGTGAVLFPSALPALARLGGRKVHVKVVSAGCQFQVLDFLEGRVPSS